MRLSNRILDIWAIIRATALVATLGIYALHAHGFAPNVEIELDHSRYDLPNAQDRRDAEEESKKNGSATYTDDFGNTHTYEDGEEIH